MHKSVSVFEENTEPDLTEPDTKPVRGKSGPVQLSTVSKYYLQKIFNVQFSGQ